jgi:hypothetical protein
MTRSRFSSLPNSPIPWIAVITLTHLLGGCSSTQATHQQIQNQIQNSTAIPFNSPNEQRQGPKPGPNLSQQPISSASSSLTAKAQDCHTLASSSLKTDVQAMSLKMSLEMTTSNLVDQHLRDLKGSMAQLEQIPLSNRQVQNQRSHYIKLIYAAIKPVEQWAETKVYKTKPGIAAAFATQVEQASEFRQDKIFLGDCKAD